jgi:hypothetical protein
MRNANMGNVRVVFRVVGVGALALGTLSALVSVPSCTSSDDERKRLNSLAQDCAINSDCQSPLICAFGRCHEQCAESRDCPTGQRCVRTGSGVNVCQLTDESSCASYTDCKGEQICATDAQCRDDCADASSDKP